MVIFFLGESQESQVLGTIWSMLKHDSWSRKKAAGFHGSLPNGEWCFSWGSASARMHKLPPVQDLRFEVLIGLWKPSSCYWCIFSEIERMVGYFQTFSSFCTSLQRQRTLFSYRGVTTRRVVFLPLQHRPTRLWPSASGGISQFWGDKQPINLNIESEVWKVLISGPDLVLEMMRWSDFVSLNYAKWLLFYCME